MITYSDSVMSLRADQLVGFFVGWPNPPGPDVHLKLLRSSYAVVLAIDVDPDRVVGFITAISDGILSANIPLLEVLPEYQGRGIGSELTRTMLARLAYLYMIDITCDPELAPFYSRFGMRSYHSMIVRNFDRQTGSERSKAL